MPRNVNTVRNMSFKSFSRHKGDLLEELEKIREDLMTTYAKLLAVRKLVSDPKARKSMLVAAAFVRTAFLMPDVMGRVYLSGCLSDLKRASNKLKKLAKRKGLVESMRSRLEEAAEKLANAGEELPNLVLTILDVERELSAIIYSLTE